MTLTLAADATWSAAPLADFTLLHLPGLAGCLQDFFGPDLPLAVPRAPWPGLRAALQAAAQHFPPSQVLSVRHHDLHVERHPIHPVPTRAERPERWRSQDAPRHTDLPPALIGFPTERLWPRTGETLSPIPTAFVPVRLPGQVDQAAGRALTFDRAKSVAMLEALERRTSAEPPRQVRRHVSYLERTSEMATLDPAAMILPRPDAPGLVPYCPDLPLDWTDGLSMRRAQRVSVPARLACLNYQRDAPFLHDTSNGYALGRTPTEARLHALLEVIERDAFQYPCVELLQFAISILTLMWCQRALHSHPCHRGGNEWDAAYGMGVSFDGWVLGISVLPLDLTGVSPGRVGLGGRVVVLMYIWP